MKTTEKMCVNCMYNQKKTRKKVFTCTNENSEFYNQPTYEEDCCSKWEWNGEES